MILPIVGLGDPILRKVAAPISPDYPNLKELIANMYETMYAADGVGLAAPQIDLSIRLVVIGFRPYDEKTETYGTATEEHTLINPEILGVSTEKNYFCEGCLSIPGIHEDVLRPVDIRIHYFDADWNEHFEEISGMYSRVAQHEIDHLDGKVFTDRVSQLRKTLIRRKVNDVIAGKYRTTYRMKRK
ncbi:MAG: peptide deformylase [Bacteroidales bacterium]|nr:peptide deformylase [Candidatus Colimorpha onthohippi]